MREKTEVPKNVGKNIKRLRFPYKSLRDPNYLKDKRDFLSSHKNGWWLEDKTRYRGRRKPSENTNNN